MISEKLRLITPQRGPNSSIVRRFLFVVHYPHPGAFICSLVFLLAGCDPSNLPKPPTPTRAITPVGTATQVISAASPTRLTESVAATPTLMPISMREDISDEVRLTVDRNYLYPDFHGADWQALRKEYQAKIDIAT